MLILLCTFAYIHVDTLYNCMFAIFSVNWSYLSCLRLNYIVVLFVSIIVASLLFEFFSRLLYDSSITLFIKFAKF